MTDKPTPSTDLEKSVAIVLAVAVVALGIFFAVAPDRFTVMPSPAERNGIEADARAAAAYARAYARNPEFAAFYRSMQAYKNTLGLDGDILVIAPEGEFFKYLHSASGR